jgi:succinate-semialdehyde dehydrogenase/glutarate-semialdehyde dehydrogenase
MELGGHAPVFVFADADVDGAAKTLAAVKYRNAGQTCISPTRFLIERLVFDRFVDGFVEAARTIKVGLGSDPGTQMGPMANARRIDAMQRLTADAISKGAKLAVAIACSARAFFSSRPSSLMPLTRQSWASSSGRS